MSRHVDTMLRVVILVALLQAGACEKGVRRYFERLNNETKSFNAIAAELAWERALKPNDTDLPSRAAEFQDKYLTWRQSTCGKLRTLQYTTVLNKSQKRQIYLFCRGLNYTLDEAREVMKLLSKLQSIYADSEICIPDSKKATRENLTSIEEVILNYLSKERWNWDREKIFLLNDEEGIAPDAGSYCIRGENDFNRIMSFSRNEEVLKWTWETWRDVIAPMREPYESTVNLENKAASRSEMQIFKSTRFTGYSNIGEFWRQDMEIPELKQLCDHLYQTVKPLYKLLHGVTRYFLRREYGMMVSERGPIPAHLLGDLWAQNWEPLADLILPQTIDLNERMRKAKVKWDLNHMLKRAEDFYTSLGLPAMTDAFWRESIFSRENFTAARCHGTAADMFKNGDFRMIYCSDLNFQDFYVLHHEMGHIQYYMAYEKQPAIFRQGNTALHESIGDTIMIGVMTPQHLHRLGLVDDSVLYPKIEIDRSQLTLSKISGIDIEVGEDYYDDSYERTDTPDEDMQADAATFAGKTVPDITADDILLLRVALAKLPQIPFALAMDEYRWKYFEGRLSKRHLNKEFWTMLEKLQGIAPPGNRGEEYFDVGAKFHVPDNTPYIRYYLSSFLQHQLFESLCKAAVFGRRNVKEPVPASISIHRCDIYGSKSAGKLLRDIMSRGDSESIRDILEATIGTSNISAAALERYYSPLTQLLQRLVDKYRIPLGW